MSLNSFEDLLIHSFIEANLKARQSKALRILRRFTQFVTDALVKVRLGGQNVKFRREEPYLSFESSLIFFVFESVTSMEEVEFFATRFNFDIYEFHPPFISQRTRRTLLHILTQKETVKRYIAEMEANLMKQQTVKLLNSCDIYNCTPLVYAIQRNHLDIAELLMDHGAELELSSSDESIFIHVNSIHTLKFVIEHLGHARSKASLEQSNGNSLLHCLKLGPEAFDIVMNQIGASAQVLSHYLLEQESFQALDLCSVQKLFAIMEQNCPYTLQQILNLKRGQPRDHIIHFLISTGVYRTMRPDVFSFIMRHHLCQLFAANKQKRNVLHAMEACFDVAILRSLLCSEQMVNIDPRDQDKNSPLHLLCMSAGHIASKTMIRLFIDFGASLTAANRHLLTPMDYVLKTGFSEREYDLVEYMFSRNVELYHKFSGRILSRRYQRSLVITYLTKKLGNFHKMQQSNSFSDITIETIL